MIMIMLNWLISTSEWKKRYNYIPDDSVIVQFGDQRRTIRDVFLTGITLQMLVNGELPSYNVQRNPPQLTRNWFMNPKNYHLNTLSWLISGALTGRHKVWWLHAFVNKFTFILKSLSTFYKQAIRHKKE